MKTKLIIYRWRSIRNLIKCYFLVLVCFVVAQSSLFAQKHYALGANVLTNKEYSQLPKPNWDTLTKYSPKRLYPEMTIETPLSVMNPMVSGKSVMLSNTPPIGNQGNEGSCVGWATGYCATGILTDS